MAGPGPKENRQKLYKAMLSGGLLEKDITEQGFEASLKDDETRHSVYKMLNEGNYFKKSFEDFSSLYAEDVVKKKEPTLQKQGTGLPSNSTTSPTGLPQTSPTPTAENKYVTDSMIDLNEVAKNPLFVNDPDNPGLQEKIKNGTVGMGDINWANYRSSIGQNDDAPFKYPKEMDAKISELDKKKAKELEVLDKRLAAKTLTAQEHSALKKERMSFYDTAIGDLNGKKKEFIAKNFDDSDAAAFGIHQNQMKQEVKLLVNETPAKTDALAARNDVAFQKLQQKQEAAKSFEDDPNYMMLDPNKTISQNKEDIESADLKKREDKADRLEQEAKVALESGAMAKWDKSQWEAHNKQKASDEYSYAQIEEVLDEMGLEGTERAETRTTLLQKAKTEPMLRDAEIKARELANSMGVKTPEQTIQAYKERTAKVNEAYSVAVTKKVEDLKATSAIIDDNHNKEVSAYHAAAEKELVDYRNELNKQVEAGAIMPDAAQKLFDQRKQGFNDRGNDLYKAYVGRRTKYQSDVTKEIERLGMMKTGMLGEVAKLKAEYGIKEDEEGKLGFTEDYMNEYNAIWQSVVSQAEYTDRVKKDLAWDKMGFEQKISQSVSSGMLNLAETMGVGVKWFAPGLDFPDIAIDFVEDYREGAPKKDMSQHSLLEKLTDLDYMVNAGAEQIPLMLPMVGASVLGYSAASGALKGFRLSTKARAALAATVGGAGSRLVEANMEGYSVFQEKLKSGADWQEAYDAGVNVRNKNAALMIFDSFQTYIAFAKQPKLLMTSKGYEKPTALQGALTKGMDLGLTFASGASEEVLQEYFAESEFNPMLNLVDFATSEQGLEIGMMGGIMESVFAANGIIRGRGGLATVNDQFTKFFEGMDADQVSADDMANRSLDLIQTLEHLKSREVITQEEYDQGLSAVNSTVEDFKAAANGELPFQWKDDRLKQYTAFRSEAEALRKQAEDLPKSKALEKETLNKRADLLDKEVENLYKNVEANTYSIDGVPVTKSEFESILNDPENLAQLEGHKLETDDMAIHAKLISEKGVLSERIKAIEEAKSYVSSVSEGMGVDYAIQLHTKAMEEQADVLTEMKNVGNGSKYRAEVQKARKMDAMMEGLKALKAQEKDTVGQAVSDKSAELTAAASTFLDKEGKTEPTQRDIAQTSAKLEKENAKLADGIFEAEKAVLEKAKADPNYRNKPEYLQEKSVIADSKIKIRENNKLLDGMKILSKDSSIPETKTQIPIQEATNEMVESRVEETATKASTETKTEVVPTKEKETTPLPSKLTEKEQVLTDLIAENEALLANNTDPNANPAIQKQIDSLKKRLADVQKNDTSVQKEGEIVQKEVETGTKEEESVQKEEVKAEVIPQAKQPANDREKGYREIDGKRIDRPAPIANKIVGKKKNVTFGRNAKSGKLIKIEAEYTVVEMDDVQASHYGGSKNQKFFIDEAQPRDRAKDHYKEQDQLRGSNLDPEELGVSSNAYFGAPVVNERGEVIQGNGRAAAMRWYHKNKDSKEYKEWLKNEAEELGISQEELAKMKNPVLVRMVKATDAEAINLGNMTAKNLEDVSREGEAESAALKTIAEKDKITLANIILENSDNEGTVKEVVREAGMKALKYMVDIGMLRTEERAQMISNSGVINGKGVDYLEKIIKAMFFQGTSNADFTAMDNVHGNIRQGVERAIVGLLSTEDSKALNKEIANIVAVLSDYFSFKRKYPNTSFDNWMSQIDMYGKTPADRMTESERAIASYMATGDGGDVPTQKQIAAKLQQYVKEVGMQEETLFSPADKGLSKEEAVKKVFPAKKPKTDRPPTEQYSTRPIRQTKQDVKEAAESFGSAESYADSTTKEDFPVKLSMVPRAEIEAYKKQNRGLVPFRRDVIKGLRKSLGFLFEGMKFIPRILYAKSRRQGVLGSISGTNMQVKISNYADIPTIIHELGHWMDMAYGITRNSKSKLDMELSQFWDFGSTPPDAKNKSMIAKAKESLKRQGNNNPTENQIADEIDNLQHEYRKMEGFAEFVRAWTLNPQAAIDMAPKTYEAMKNAITSQRNGTKKWAELEKASYDIRLWMSLNPMEMAQSTSQETAQQFSQRPFLQKQAITLEDFLDKWGIKSVNGTPNLSFWDKMQILFTNSKKPLKTSMRDLFKMNGINPDDVKMKGIDQDFYLLTRLMAGKNDKAREFLEKSGLRQIKIDPTGVVGYEKILDNGQAMTIGWLLEPLSDHPNFKDSTTDERAKQLDDDKELAVKIMVAERTLELAKRFEREDTLSGLSGDQYVMSDVEAAQKILDEFETYPDALKQRVLEFNRRYRAMADATLQYAKDSGLLSEEKYAEIKAANLSYVALNRIFEDEMGHVSGGKGSGGQGKGQAIKKIEGSVRDRGDAVENMIATFYGTLNRADQNYINGRFVSLLRGDEFGLDAPMPLEKFGVRVDGPGEGVMEYYNNGKAEYWKLDPDIAMAFGVLRELSSHNSKAFMAVDASMKAIGKVLGLGPKVVQFTITRFPIFARVVNPIRDYGQRLVVSRTARMPFVATLEKTATKLGVPADLLEKMGFQPNDFELTDAQARELFFVYGGGQSGHDIYLKSDKHYHKALYYAIKDLAKKGSKIPAADTIWGKYNDFLGEGELSNRIAEFKSAYKHFKMQGLSDYAASKAAAFEARDLCDFAIQGTAMQFLRHSAPFLNANIQGMKRYFKFLKEMTVDGWQQKDPTLFARFAMFSALPSIAMTVMAYAFGYEDEYAELPNHQRDMFYNFKLYPGQEGYVSIPKPFEVGILGSNFERFIDMTVYGRESSKAYDGYLGIMSRGMVPMNPLDYYSYMGTFKPLLEVKGNYDSFRDDVIVYDDKKILKERTGTKYASNLGQWLGGDWADPRNIDHLIGGWFGYMGNHAIKVSNLIGEREAASKPSQTYNMSVEGILQEFKLYRHTNPANLKVVRNVLNDIKTYGLSSQEDPVVLDGMLDASRSGEGDQAKMIKDIVKYAESMNTRYEKSKELYDKWLDGNLKEYNGESMEGLTNSQAKNILFVE